MTCDVHPYVYAHTYISIYKDAQVCVLIQSNVSVSEKINLYSKIKLCASTNMVDEQDGLLPIANVGRIMKQILPQRAKISKEAKQRMQECATEFLSFVTAEASDKCHKENRKTVNGDDICWALSALGFDNYAQATIRYLHKYREAERDKAAANANNNNQNKAADIILMSSGQDMSDIGDRAASIYMASQQGLQVGEQTQTPDLEFRLLGKGDGTKPSVDQEHN